MTVVGPLRNVWAKPLKLAGAAPPEGGFNLAHLLPHQVSVVAGRGALHGLVAQGEAAPGRQVAEHQALLAAVGGGGVVAVPVKGGGDGLVAEGLVDRGDLAAHPAVGRGLALAALRAAAAAQRQGDRLAVRHGRRCPRPPRGRRSGSPGGWWR